MILKHANGTEVTAPEAYDAFMNSRVLIVQDGTTYEAISMVWYDNNSTQGAPANVGYVKFSVVYDDNSGGVGIGFFEAGNSSLVPA